MVAVPARIIVAQVGGTECGTRGVATEIVTAVILVQVGIQLVTCMLKQGAQNPTKPCVLAGV